MTAMVSSAASEKTAVGEQHCPDYFSQSWNLTTRFRCIAEVCRARLPTFCLSVGSR
jgi:hypothetical protein